MKWKALACGLIPFFPSSHINDFLKLTLIMLKWSIQRWLTKQNWLVWMQLFHGLHDSDLASAVWPYSCVFNYAGSGGDGSGEMEIRIQNAFRSTSHFPLQKTSWRYPVILTSGKHLYVQLRAKWRNLKKMLYISKVFYFSALLMIIWIGMLLTTPSMVLAEVHWPQSWFKQQRDFGVMRARYIRTLSNLTKDPLGLMSTIMWDFSSGRWTNGMYNYLFSLLYQETSAVLATFESVWCGVLMMNKMFRCGCGISFSYRRKLSVSLISKTKAYTNWIFIKRL